MGVAAQVAAWAKRWPNGRFSRNSSTSSVGGVPFENGNILALYPNARLIVEAAFGADPSGEPQMWNWYDITTFVRHDSGLSLSPFGKSDESSTAQPAGLSFALDNTDSRFTAYSQASVYYPYVRRNTPIRVSLNLTGQSSDSIVWFQGFANGFVPSWDTSANLAVVSVSASGVTRRLVQRNSPLKSALSRAMVAANPTAYWSLEEPSGATEAAGTPNPLTVTTGTVEFATTAADIPGSVNALDPQGGTMFAALDSTQFTSGILQIEFSGAYRTAVAGTPSVAVSVRVSNGNIISFILSAALWDGLAHHVAWQLQQNGADISIDSYRDGVYIENQVLSASTLGTPIETWININLADDDTIPVLAHVALFSAFSDPSIRGTTADGFAGETATARLARLCAEENVPIEFFGTSTSTMGAQDADTFMNLVRECEAVDNGVLFDGRSAGLSYITREQRYNADVALTVDADLSQIAPPFNPADDDQRNLNLAIVSRKNGGSATYEDSDGPLGTDAIGVYDTAETVNVETDDVLTDYAGWLVHLGTAEGFRYPYLNLNFSASPELISSWLNAGISSRIDVTNIANRAIQHPQGDVRLLVEGWSEQLSPYFWTATANMSQYDSWVVAVLDSLGFTDCGESTLAEELDTTETGVDVSIADTCVWTHADGDYDIVIDGEVMTVTAVSAASGSGSSWTQTLTVTRSVNGVVSVHGPGAAVQVVDAFIPSL